MVWNLLTKFPDIVSDKEYEIKQFVITKELVNLPHILGYEQYKNTNKNILAPEEILKKRNNDGYDQQIIFNILQ
ncbi:MAG: hypothetical protein K8R85_05395 [Bacteroidetes bacterium]|nr:hypothetical protein [Bacteroidota bacterium]